jgi:hypothetical protein
MDHINRCFAASYQDARAKFLAAADMAGLPVDSLLHPLPGADGEVLALDVVADGVADADRILLVSSACHGVEGFCGSAVQVAALCDAELRQQARELGVCLLYLHALNPHGFSFGRRVTHENVDLNRNFVDFSQAPPQNHDYRELHPLLLPPEWPPGPAHQAALQQAVGRLGVARFQDVVSGGQYEFADGLFFGGLAPTWSHHTLRQLLRRYAAHATHLAWIDVHTGLGENGVGERIFCGHPDSAALPRARRWWDPAGTTPVTCTEDGSSSSSPLSGLMWQAIEQECPQAEFTGIALEYGTQPLLQVMQALRADHWLHLHPEAAPQLARQIRQQIRDAFYCDSDQWRAQIIDQARQVLFQANAGLAGMV